MFEKRGVIVWALRTTAETRVLDSNRWVICLPMPMPTSLLHQYWCVSEAGAPKSNLMATSHCLPSHPTEDGRATEPVESAVSSCWDSSVWRTDAWLMLDDWLLLIHHKLNTCVQYRRRGTFSYSTRSVSGSGTTSYTITNLKLGTVYELRVATVGPLGQSGHCCGSGKQVTTYNCEHET